MVNSWVVFQQFTCYGECGREETEREEMGWDAAGNRK